MNPYVLLYTLGAFVFVPALIIYTVVYIGRCYAVVLSQSSGGDDLIRWPKDRFQEWVGDAVMVLLIFVALASLIAFMAAPLAFAFPERWQALAILGLAVVLFWIAFPIVLCTAHHPALIVAWPKRFGAMLRVWCMTTPLAALVGFGVVLLIMNNASGAFLVAIVGPPMILVHARAWGRFVWLAVNERPRRRKKPKSERPPEPETAMRSKEPTAATKTVVDDGAIGLAADDWTPESDYLAEHYEIQRERERWNRLKAGDDSIDAFGRKKSPTKSAALAPDKIFGLLLQAETAAAAIRMSVVLALLSVAVLVIHMAI